MTQTGRIGFRIVRDIPRPDADVVDALREIPAANVADGMGRFNFMDSGMTLRSGSGMCGVALTVKARPGDNLMVHKALELAQPGDIVVVVTGGSPGTAVFGDLMCRTAIAQGVGGLIVDGAIRDVDSIQALGFPSVSRSVALGGCDKDGPGEINVPIACGGAVVMPGDIVVADAGGVAVVPRAEAAEVLALARAIMAKESGRVQEIATGSLFKAEIDDTLRACGVIE